MRARGEVRGAMPGAVDEDEGGFFGHVAADSTEVLDGGD